MEYKFKLYLKENPLDADNAEDLSTWAAEEFDLTDAEMDEVYNYCRDVLDMPK